MSACEKCWRDAGGEHSRYLELLEQRASNPCTPEEQRGERGPEFARFEDIACETHGDFVEITDRSVYAGRPLKMTIEQAQFVRDFLIRVLP